MRKAFVPEMASSIFLRAPNVVIPSSFRSWSVRVRKVWRSIWKQQRIVGCFVALEALRAERGQTPRYLLLLEDVRVLPQAQVAEQLRQV